MNESTDELVPLGLVADELGMSRADLEYRYAADVVRDDLGLRCLPAPVAKRVIADRDAAETRRLEEVRRRDAEAEAEWRPPRGVPATFVPEGMTAAEFITSIGGPPDYSDGGGFSVPRRSFGDWLDEERAIQVERAKERAKGQLQ